MLTRTGKALLERWIYVLVKVGAHFVVPYTGARLAAVHGAGYGEAFAPLLERCLATLAEPGWQPGSYYPGGWMRALADRGEHPAAAPITAETLRPYCLEEVSVDEQGHWRVGDKAITGRVLGHFLRNLHFDGELGRYLIRYRLEAHFETRYLHHRSPPIRVRRVTARGGAALLRLNTGRSEPLRPETLRLGADERLYCAVGAEGLPAWFEEPARWELLKDAQERDGAWVLSIGGRELNARLDAPWTFADGVPA